MQKQKQINSDKKHSSIKQLKKVATGIQGFDEITNGGLPAGRPTLIYGGPGCGKTLFALHFIAHGAQNQNENGVIITFEETTEELILNAASIGIDLQRLIDEKKVFIDHIKLDGHELQEAGAYNLEGLLLRIQSAIEEVKAKRIVLDTLEAVFSYFTRKDILRAEFNRIFRWLKERNLSAIVTGEVNPNAPGNGTREGLEEYITDCVIFLDHRTENQVATRRLKVVKYRGSSHGTNEYPFLISDWGINVFPITTVKLDYKVGDEYISTGVPDLDEMLGGKGLYKGSTVLVSGTAGTGKTTLGASFVSAACERGEKGLLISFEESPSQIIRNMRSVGFDLQKYVDQGLLEIHSFRPTMYGLEMHLVILIELIKKVNPQALVIDPINSFLTESRDREVKLMLMRLTDFLKLRNITALMLSLTTGGEHTERSNVAISSIVDTWIILRDIEQYSERNRGIFILKSRGHAHSHQIREFKITDQGIKLVDVYRGVSGVLTGTAREAQQVHDDLERLRYTQEIERLNKKLENRRRALENQIEMLRANFEAEAKEIELQIEQLKLQKQLLEERNELQGNQRS